MIEYSEKRDFIRMAMHGPAHYRLEGTQELQHATVKDLSGGGVSLLADRPVAAGSRLALKIMPGKSITPPLAAWIRVIRCERSDEGNYTLACSIEKMLAENEAGPDFP